MSIPEQLRARNTAWKPKELMTLVNLSKSLFYREIEQGKLRALRFGGALRIDPMDALVWYERSLTI
jgi:excisionase family DNA binding protein